MTLRDWLARERQPHYSGINARQTLKAMVPRRKHWLHWKIALNALAAAEMRLIVALQAARPR